MGSGEFHLDPEKRGEFCAYRPDDDCECGNNYRAACEPSPSWATFWEAPARPVQVGFEAHHILVVDSVNTLPGNSKQAERVVNAQVMTTWCINAKRNMIALPQWGQTVRHYSRIGSALSALVRRSTEPPFKDLPQHDFDHPAYTGEVTETILDAYEEVAEAVKECEFDPVTLASQLDSLSSRWRSTLRARGTRQGGTHKAWNTAMDDRSYVDWVLPFSMTSASKAQRRAFPQKAGTQLDRIVEVMLSAGVV